MERNNNTRKGRSNNNHDKKKRVGLASLRTKAIPLGVDFFIIFIFALSTINIQLY